MGVAGPFFHVGREAKQLEQRLIELVADNLLALAKPSLPGILHEGFDPLEYLRGIILPGRVFPQTAHEEVVGKQRPVAEVVFAEGGRLKNAAELVELFQSIAASPRESADRPQFLGSNRFTGNCQTQRDNLDTMYVTRAAHFPAPLVEQDELDLVEVGCEDQ